MNTLDIIKKNHREKFLPRMEKLNKESRELGIENEFSIQHESEYIIFQNFTYYVEKVENGIVELYDEDGDETKKIPLNEIVSDLSFQGY